MNRPDYQVRVISEHEELSERLHRLRDFLHTNMFQGLDKAEQTRLREQAGHMTQYARVLAERIAAF